MNIEERKNFVEVHRTAVFGYNRKEDGPSLSVVYDVMDGDDILISTMLERGKAKAVRRNPKVSLCVLDEKWERRRFKRGAASIGVPFRGFRDVV